LLAAKQQFQQAIQTSSGDYISDQIANDPNYY